MAISEPVLVSGKLGCPVGAGGERTAGGPPPAYEPHGLLNQVLAVEQGAVELLVPSELHYLGGVAAAVVEGLTGRYR